MRRPFSILLLLLGLAACASQGDPTASPEPAPAIPPAPAPLSGGLIAYARSIQPAPAGDYQHRQSDLVVVDELGREQRTLPITSVIEGFATNSPNKAIYRTTEGYFLVDAAQGTVQRLPITQPNPLVPLVPHHQLAHPGKRWILLTERRGGMTVSSKVFYLIDLERGTAVELNALLNAEINDSLNVLLSPDEKYVLAKGVGDRLAVIPTADPARWRTLLTSDWLLGYAWSADSRSVIYAASNGSDQGLMRVSVDGGPPELLIGGMVYGWTMLNNSNHIIVSNDQGLIVLDPSSKQQHRIDQCAAATQIIMSDSDDHFLCSGSSTQDWSLINLADGSATFLSELDGSVPRSPEYQRWAVFGTLTGGDYVNVMPTRILDLHTGRIAARIDDSNIIDVAPDGSAVLLSDGYSTGTIWLYGSDGSSRLIHNAQPGASARFSPDGRFIVVSNTLYDTAPTPGPISVFDRSGTLIRTLDIPGINPIWLEQ